MTHWPLHWVECMAAINTWPSSITSKEGEQRAHPTPDGYRRTTKTAYKAKEEVVRTLEFEYPPPKEVYRCNVSTHEVFVRQMCEQKAGFIYRQETTCDTHFWARARMAKSIFH